jgi:hypothetical protein
MAGTTTQAARAHWRVPRAVHPSPAALRCRSKFLRFFRKGFQDETYLDWERGYKWDAHTRWHDVLGREAFRALLDQGKFQEAAGHAVRIEARTNLLFSFEKMALRDAVRSAAGARSGASGLYEFLYGRSDAGGFERWCSTLASLPARKTKVLSWPMATVFGMIARPDAHMFLKPLVTRRAAREYGIEFHYRAQPNWDTYASLLDFAGIIRRDLQDLAPRDMIDLQSFIWVQGSSEYEE